MKNKSLLYLTVGIAAVFAVLFIPTQVAKHAAAEFAWYVADKTGIPRIGVAER